MGKGLFFGTAGIPKSTEPRNTINGLAEVKNLGLDGMELEFVHSVNIGEAKAPDVKAAAEKHDLTLTCHGQYYINLSPKEEAKLEASKQRVINAATRSWQCGAKSVTFHPGFYMGRDEASIYKMVFDGMKDIRARLDDLGVDIRVSPETTGKGTQFGTFEELFKMASELDNVGVCIDFSHIHARSNGKFNTKDEFHHIMSRYEEVLGKEALKKMHMHLSGIEYGEKGEKHHLILKESDMNYKDLLATLKEFGAEGMLICESPNIEVDAQLLKKTYQEL